MHFPVLIPGSFVPSVNGLNGGAFPINSTCESAGYRYVNRFLLALPTTG